MRKRETSKESHCIELPIEVERQSNADGELDPNNITPSPEESYFSSMMKKMKNVLSPTGWFI